MCPPYQGWSWSSSTVSDGGSCSPSFTWWSGSPLLRRSQSYTATSYPPLLLLRNLDTLHAGPQFYCWSTYRRQTSKYLVCWFSCTYCTWAVLHNSLFYSRQRAGNRWIGFIGICRIVNSGWFRGFSRLSLEGIQLFGTGRRHWMWLRKFISCPFVRSQVKYQILYGAGPCDTFKAWTRRIPRRDWVLWQKIEDWRILQSWTVLGRADNYSKTPHHPCSWADLNHIQSQHLPQW